MRISKGNEEREVKAGKGECPRRRIQERETKKNKKTGEQENRKDQF